MKNTAQGFLALMIIGLIFPSSCKKYEEGPCLSVLPKSTRVIGYKVIEKYYVDGADSTYITDAEFNNCYFYFSEFSKKEGFGGTRTYQDGRKIYGDYRGWHFIEKKDSIYLVIFPPTYPQNGPYISFPYGTTWKILRLTERDMWLKTIYKEKTREIHYKKIKK